MADLGDLRKKIDEVDERLVRLFEERLGIVSDIAEYKAGAGKQVYDAAREFEKLDMIEALVQKESDKRAIRDLFEQVLRISREFQQEILEGEKHGN